MTNVVILMNDQHSHDALGCAGYGELKTPALDRLAADGVRFTQASCACTPCLPSRHNLFHGLYSFQTGVYSNGHRMLPEDIPDFTMARVLGRAGYRAASCGKMHWFPYHAPVEPGRYFGFEYRTGHFHETGEVMDGSFPAEHRDWTLAWAAEREAHGTSKGGDGCATDFIGFDSALPESQSRDWYSAGKAAQFIAENAESPLLAVCSLIDPHAPHIAASDFAGMYDPAEVPMPPKPPADLVDAGDYDRFDGVDRESLRTVISRYMACVGQTDACHARVLDALDAAGLYDETLIVFLSDHGELLGARGPTAFSKYNLYEQSIRVPLIVKPPKGMKARAGTTCDSLVSLVDVLPTILSITGVDGANRLPGIDLTPHLRGETPEREREVALTEYWRRDRLYTAVRGRRWKLLLGPHGEELYDLAEDPHEFDNLAGDPDRTGVIAELRSQLLGEYRHVFNRSGDKCRGFEPQEWSALME
ncbi:MAG: sulfatase family protein [Planctomycetota bacterium]